LEAYQNNLRELDTQANREALKALQPYPAGRELARKIDDRSARVGVIGLGYVGLPLTIEMAHAGFDVTGIDTEREKVESINAGICYIPDIPSKTLLSFVKKRKIKATQSLEVVRDLDIMSICVPTPLRKSKDPDLSYVVAAVQAVHNHLHEGQLIILESTTYPGTTEELVLPILEQSGLKVGTDFFVAYSPERIDPSNQIYNTRTIPKVIGGVTPRCTELAALFYQQFIDRIVLVSSTGAAEMIKLLENTFRSVNIALANEMALLCHKLGINVWEVIDGAKTKPFGFMPFYPGPGLGGHCIPVDPYYLTWKARMNGFEPRLIELAGQINGQMPSFMIDRIANALNEHQKSLKGSKILALGVAYKRDTNDIRESPALEVLRALQEKGALVHYSDPCVPSVELNGKAMESVCLTEEILRSMDCVVVLTDHSAFNSSMIATHSPLIIDSRNMLRDFQGPNIVRL